MKKILACLLMLCMVLSLAACAAQQNGTPSADGKTKMGMAIKATATADGAEASFTTLAAVVLTDENGKILSCRLDEIQLKPAVEDGKLKDVTDFRTKYELGENYGMSVAGAKAEWYAQVDAFCAYVKGKTADEVLAIELKDNKPTDADLTAGCTIMVNGFMAVVADAAKAATDCGAAATDKLGLAVTASRYAESEDTAPRYDVSVSGVATADGKVTACRMDELQKSFAIEKGAFVAEDGDVKSKAQLGAEYGMKSVSAIGLEWNEQIANLEAHLAGKAVADVKLTDGKATDLTSGCTMYVAGMLDNVQKAVSSAK